MPADRVIALNAPWASAQEDAALRQLYQQMNEILPRHIEFDGFTLEVDAGGANIYRSTDYLHASRSSLYQALAHEAPPAYVLDIGANIGFSSVLFARAFPHADIYAFEPNPEIASYFERNVQRNQISNVRRVNKLMGAAPCAKQSFQVNTAFSVDSRVSGLSAHFSLHEIPQTSIDAFIAEQGLSGRFFIKIDTQGYEEHVLEGGSQTLSDLADSYIMMEFAPFWLQQAGTAPTDFLRRLCERHRVVELSSAPAFHVPDLAAIKQTQIHAADADVFVAYVQSLHRAGRGWCDLLIYGNR
ncbi:MAG: FkbM family methyltransferase [Alcaligenes aquatilis]